MSKRLLIGFGAVLVIALGLGTLRPLSWHLARLRWHQRADEEAHARARGFKALIRIGSAAVPKLSRSLKHSDARVRREAASALFQVGEEAQAAVPALAAALQDE